MHGEPLLSLIDARAGHFLYESGHHGDLWLELDTLFARPAALRPHLTKLARRLAPHGADVICGPMVGGAFLAQLVACELGIDFTHALRFEGKAGPGALYPVEYRIPTALRDRITGRAVAVMDDVINAGSATRATVADVRACGARPVVIGALLVLGTNALDYAAEQRVALEALERRESHLWTPLDCPLCAGGVALEDLTK